ncbi:hypothetical protein SAMN05443252_10986 [Bacillus sp. OV322]|uniref:hypothetical protein n=1 Tax=Bacillus sp. OV322 TaxID=1882764 RepID=UPI0008DF7587|nr:hypothetical protein [Bacillus sp. OV322]SFC94751.1 hypothetical protein SAMN05443252_10986 [Bacillus sp. OV322]
MNLKGHIPQDLTVLETLESIGENIIIADQDFYITWINTRASQLLSMIAPLFGLQIQKK